MVRLNVQRLTRRGEATEKPDVPDVPDVPELPEAAEAAEGAGEGPAAAPSPAASTTPDSASGTSADRRRVRKPKTSRATRATPVTRVQFHSAVNSLRNATASVVWLVSVLGAIVLALGALLIALSANTDNSLVNGALDAARAIDGPFWKVFDFYKDTKSGGQGPPDDVKNHLVNWGLAAVGYLVAGRVLDRIIRP